MKKEPRWIRVAKDPDTFRLKVTGGYLYRVGEALAFGLVTVDQTAEGELSKLQLEWASLERSSRKLMPGPEYSNAEMQMAVLQKRIQTLRNFIKVGAEE